MGPVKLQINLLCLAAVALASAQAPEKFDLSRKPKLGDVNKYHVAIQMNESPKMEVSGTLTSKVLKVPANSKIEIEISCADFKALSDGSPTSDFEHPTIRTVAVGPNSLPDSMQIRQSEILSSVLLFCSYLPNKSVAVGDTFKVDWRSKSGSGYMEGDGKLEFVVEKDGKKIGIVKWKASIQPDDVNGAADLTMENQYDLATGALISSKATGTTPDGDLSISVKPAK